MSQYSRYSKGVVGSSIPATPAPPPLVDSKSMSPYAKMGPVPALAFEKNMAFSGSVWTKVTVNNNPPSSDGGSIIGNIANNVNAVGWDLYNAAAINGDTGLGFQPRLSFADMNAVSVIGVETQALFSGGGWFHTVFTYNGANSGNPANDIKLYVNGVLMPNQSVHANSIIGSMVSPFSFNLGARNYGTGSSAVVHQFNGLMDMVSIFNGVLSQTDVTTLYNSGQPVDVSLLPCYSNCIVWLPIGEGTDTTSIIHDLKSGYDATGTNVTLVSDVP